MATKSKKSSGPTVAFDELGGTADGGLAIIDEDGQVVHRTQRRIAGALRYFVARADPSRADFAAPEHLPQRVAVLSALRGEGVTFVARSLASVLAYDTGRTVVLVDLNWRSPTTDVPAGTEATRQKKRRSKTAVAADGATTDRLTLADAVERGAAVSDIVRPTTNPRLSLVDAGELALARRPAVAGGAALEAVLGKIANDFDHVVFDVPPVLASSDAIRLAQLADAYVLVVRQGRTATGQIEAALDELRGQASLGVILNRVTSRVPRTLRRILGA